ncbi:hypothetical protein ILUMI_15868 [Ignelater luminosus]|uniref:Uncharacterized protein n=1 Tax=Ignelater luminosus TaxID=2038154 RepID=A0A8K0CVK7_IGNLU|nr:hypothetical protein ILUMI_15868 [Ignelater luminosus]
MRTKIFSALATVLQKLKSCLHSEEEYISDFVAGWYNNSFEKQCTNGNETTVGYIDTILFGPPCEKLSPSDVDERFEKCFSPSGVMKNFQAKNFILRKDSLCLYLEHGSECFLDFLNGDCNEYQFFKILFAGMKIECNTYINNISN